MPTIALEHFSLSRERLFFIAGPCVIESKETTLEIAAALRELADRLGVPVVFKSSYDKANRTSHRSYRGPGLRVGLDILATVRQQYRLPVLADVHHVGEVAPAAEILDIIQIPAFLCRQTDLVCAAAATGKPVNVKKGQFLAPWDMENVVAKIRSTGNNDVILTERGTCFGYNNLVVDMRALAIMRQYGLVVFDATHSVQLPGGAGTCSGGDRRYVATLAKAAVAAGADGVFMEVHPQPDRALCDGPNSLALAQLEDLVATLLAVGAAARGNEGGR